MNALNTAPQLASPLDAARSYVRRGWAIVPIPRGEKAPQIKSWPEIRFAESELPQHFADGANVGVILGTASGGLVDIDLDSREAIAVADYFLPRTAAIFGRASKSRSHRLYICEALNNLSRPRPEKFCAPSSETICEIRADRQQTVFPPSTHPSGEHIAWASDGTPTQVGGEILRCAVARLAAAALIVRHWPTGQRHAASLALAGMLLRGGFSKVDAATFLRAVVAATGDNELRDRIRAVVETDRCLDSGQPTTGTPTLAAIMGNAPVSRVREWLALADHAVPPASFSVTTPSWPEPLAPEAFHGLAGEIVRTIEPFSEADPAALLIETIVAFGSLVGRGPYFSVEGKRHHANLFAVIVGESSKARKGTSWGRVSDIFTRVDTTFEQRVHGGLASGEAIINSVRDDILRNNKKGDEELIEGILEKRLILFEAEFALPLRVIQRDGNTGSEILRRAWDGDRLETFAKNSGQTATGAHVSVIGHTTKNDLRRYLSETDTVNGFANRFLFFCARRSKCLPDGAAIPDEKIAALAAKLDSAVKFAASASEMRRDAEAAQLWRSVYPALSEGQPGLFGSATSRAEAQTLRLSMIFALLDCCAQVRRSHLLAALAVWDFASRSARYIFGDSLGDAAADTILAALRASPAGLTRTELRDLFGRHKGEGEIARALSLLSQLRMAVSRREATAGRAIERWFCERGMATKATEATKASEG